MEDNEFISYPRMQVANEFLLRLKKLALEQNISEISTYVLCNVMQSMADNIIHLRAENESFKNDKNNYKPD